jgi:hypothetical protein
MDEIRAPDGGDARLGGRARDALGVAHDVEVGVDEGAELADKLALAVPPAVDFKDQFGLQFSARFCRTTKLHMSTEVSITMPPLYIVSESVFQSRRKCFCFQKALC